MYSVLHIVYAECNCAWYGVRTPEYFYDPRQYVLFTLLKVLQSQTSPYTFYTIQ